MSSFSGKVGFSVPRGCVRCRLQAVPNEQARKSMGLRVPLVAPSVEPSFLSPQQRTSMQTGLTQSEQQLLVLALLTTGARF